MARRREPPDFAHSDGSVDSGRRPLPPGSGPRPPGEAGQASAPEQKEPRRPPDLGGLPETYGKDEVELLCKDPHWCFIYWEVTDGAMASAREHLGTSGEQAKLLLRVFITVALTGGREQRELRDVPLGPQEVLIISGQREAIRLAVEVGQVRALRGRRDPVQPEAEKKGQQKKEEKKEEEEKRRSHKLHFQVLDEIVVEIDEAERHKELRRFELQIAQQRILLWREQVVEVQVSHDILFVEPQMQLAIGARIAPDRRLLHQRNGQIAHSFSAAASRVWLFLAKQKRISRWSGGDS